MGLGVSLRVWNDKGSRQLFTELRRRRRMTPTCVTAGQTCTLTGSIVLLGFQCRGPHPANSGARTCALSPTHALLFLGPPFVSVRSGPPLSARGVYRRCTLPAASGAGTPRLLDTTLHIASGTGVWLGLVHCALQTAICQGLLLSEAR